MLEQSFYNEPLVLGEEKEGPAGAPAVMLCLLVGFEDLVPVVPWFYRLDDILVRNTVHVTNVLEYLRCVRNYLDVDVSSLKIVITIIICIGQARDLSLKLCSLVLNPLRVAVKLAENRVFFL